MRQKNVVILPDSGKPTRALLMAARTVADFILEGEDAGAVLDVDKLQYEARVLVTHSLRLMIEARRAEVALGIDR